MKTKKMLILVILLISMLLSGCGDLSMQIKFNPETGSGDVQMVFLVMDTSVTRVFIDTAKPLLTEMGYSISGEMDETQGEIGVISFTAEKKYEDINGLVTDMNKLAATMPFDDPLEITGGFKNTGNIFFNSKTFEVKVPVANVSASKLLASFTPEQKAELNKAFKNFQTESDISEASDAEWIMFVNAFARQSMRIGVSVIMPDDKFSTNQAFFTGDPLNPIWMVLPANDETKTATMTSVHDTNTDGTNVVMNNTVKIVAETPNTVVIIISGVLLLALIVFLIIFFGRKPKKVKSDELSDEPSSEPVNFAATDEFSEFDDIEENKDSTEEDK